jgi:hypothetical protein
MFISQSKNVSQGVFLQACVPYFMKATVETLGQDGLSLTGDLEKKHFQQTSFEKNLFWILPGKSSHAFSMLSS